MFRFLRILACTLLSVAGMAQAADKYSIIPEPERTELKPQTTKTLKLLSDKAEASLGKDAYRLAVTPGGVHLASGGREGRLYGQATLRQSRTSLPHSRRASPRRHRDKPRYSWRGLMVDPARHFIPLADLRKFADLMAYYNSTSSSST